MLHRAIRHSRRFPGGARYVSWATAVDKLLNVQQIASTMDEFLIQKRTLKITYHFWYDISLGRFGEISYFLRIFWEHTDISEKSILDTF